MRVSYFIFTSGEDGTSGLDWGIKFVSGVSNLQELNDWAETYRETLRNFALSPNLTRPFNEPGLLILPWPDKRDKDTILAGVVFPYADSQAGRPNISLVAALLPASLYMNKTPAVVFRGLWAQNSLEDIAKRPQDRKTITNRPDYLQFGLGMEKSSIPYPQFWESRGFNALTWPGENAVLCVNGHVDEYAKRITGGSQLPGELDEPEQKRGGMKKYLLWFIAAALLLGIAEFGAKILFRLNSTADTTTASQPAEPSEEEKTAAAKLESIKGNLNGLVEIVPISTEAYNNELTPQDESIWEKSGSGLFSSEMIKVATRKPSSYVNKEDFITKFAMWLGQNAPISDLLINEREVSWEVKGIPQTQKEFIESFKLKAKELIESNKAGYGEPGGFDENDIQKKLAAHLQAKRDSNDSFNYAFVFKETEALHKILIDDKPRNSYTQFTERYYLKPDWLPVNLKKIESFVEDKVKDARLPTSVEIFYENSFSLNENSGYEMVYEKFAERMLNYAKQDLDE